MELKKYQQDVIDDLSRFLALLSSQPTIASAYSAFWEAKGVPVGPGGMPFYQNTLKGVPDICLKVPTGGGKTFIAANAIKPIFDSIPHERFKAVVWLVPSDAILTQTYIALSNRAHAYRQKIDVDFGAAVEVYSKSQLLNGQNFNPTAVAEQLSIFVLSYDSFRVSKKEGYKAYQENGNLALFPKVIPNKAALLPNTDETALIQVIRSLNPVVIVDESHHATSALSVEMLENFNPCFVLELTATPKSKSNIISFVDASALKKANMVKLPVIVYNRKTQNDVFADAISIRTKLEIQAKMEQKESGRYIRPIVLFQAQPKTGDNSTTYEKIKTALIEGGIPAEEIAIKTADKDELKNVNLLSEECPIRYIITVNALKEGWDCPFAYVLATVANRTSRIDVEQILGRVLRLPYTQKNASNLLNISYVITSSADFQETLNSIVGGLNHAGYTSRDYRAKDIEIPAEATVSAPSESPFILDEADDFPTINPDELKERIAAAEASSTAEEIEKDDLLASALEQNAAYEEQTENEENTANHQAPQEVREKMNVFRMNESYIETVTPLCLPQFFKKTEPSFFSESQQVLLGSEHLTEGFSLKSKDATIDFNTVEAEIARVDTDDTAGEKPRAWQLNNVDSTYYKELFASQPSETKLQRCKGIIRGYLSKREYLSDQEIDEYVGRVLDTLTEEQISDMEASVYPYAKKIEEKIKKLVQTHQTALFDTWLAQEKIVCEPSYCFPKTISPAKSNDTYPKSLYASEEDMNDYERKVVWKLSSMENICWWHRNISKSGFMINGDVHAYPDIIAMTTGGKVLLIETKGDHLDNDESKAKAQTGHQWEVAAGKGYRYFMVFQSKAPDYVGAYSYDKFMEIVKEL